MYVNKKDDLERENWDVVNNEIGYLRDMFKLNYNPNDPESMKSVIELTYCGPNMLTKKNQLFIQPRNLEKAIEGYTLKVWKWFL